MKKLLICLAVCTAGIAHGTPITYDQHAEARQSALASLLARTIPCMRQAVQARLMAGERNDDAVASFAAQICGVALGQFMVSDMGFTTHDAATYLFAMGHAAIDDTPGVARRAP